MPNPRPVAPRASSVFTTTEAAVNEARSVPATRVGPLCRGLELPVPEPLTADGPYAPVDRRGYCGVKLQWAEYQGNAHQGGQL